MEVALVPENKYAGSSRAKEREWVGRGLLEGYRQEKRRQAIGDTDKNESKRMRAEEIEFFCNLSRKQS